MEELLLLQKGELSLQPMLVKLGLVTKDFQEHELHDSKTSLGIKTSVVNKAVKQLNPKTKEGDAKCKLALKELFSMALKKYGHLPMDNTDEHPQGLKTMLRDSNSTAVLPFATEWIRCLTQSGDKPRGLLDFRRN